MGTWSFPLPSMGGRKEQLTAITDSSAISTRDRRLPDGNGVRAPRGVCPFTDGHRARDCRRACAQVHRVTAHCPACPPQGVVAVPHQVVACAAPYSRWARLDLFCDKVVGKEGGSGAIPHCADIEAMSIANQWRIASIQDNAPRNSGIRCVGIEEQKWVGKGVGCVSVCGVRKPGVVYVEEVPRRFSFYLQTNHWNTAYRLLPRRCHRIELPLFLDGERRKGKRGKNEWAHGAFRYRPWGEGRNNSQP